MKNLTIIIAFIVLLFSSCAKEFENIDTKTNYPDTELLSDTNIEGLVTDTNGSPLDGITVDILIEGYLLASTVTSKGVFSFPDQATHQTNTIIRAHSSEHAPNFINLVIEEGTNTINQNIVVQPLDLKKSFPVDQNIDFNIAQDFKAELAAASFENEVSEVLLTAKSFDYTISDKNLMGIRTGLDMEGQQVLVSLNQIYYVGAYDLEDEKAILNSNKSYTVNIPILDGATLWGLNISNARWEALSDYTIENNQYRINTDEFTYFASVLGDCENDIDPPIAICFNELTINFAERQTVYANECNLGSVDNCSGIDSLSFKIKILNDLCGTVNTLYADSIKLCDLGQLGSSFPMRLLVADQSGNLDSCDFTINTIPADCGNDMVPPVANFIASPSFTLRAGYLKLDADELDNGSYDECGGALVFQIKKVNDFCGNGSDQYNSYIEFCWADAGTSVEVLVDIIDESFNITTTNVSIAIEAPDCSIDTIGPRLICRSRRISLTNGFKEVSANYLDHGSDDICSENLTFQIKKTLDICGNGSDEYSNSISFCEEEMGTTVFLWMLVTDDNNNTGVCAISHSISDEDCINDTKKPLIITHANYVHRYSQGATLNVEDIDDGSFDACTDNLNLTIQKLTDVCGNGSIMAGTSINFCSEEINSNVKVRFIATDDRMNVRIKDFEIKVLN